MILGTVLGDTVKAIIGNRTDSLLVDSLGALAKNFENTEKRLINHDLQKAVTRSFYLAKISICKECTDRERGNTNAIEWLKSTIKETENAIRKIDRNDYTFLPIDDVDDIRLLLATEKTSMNYQEKIANFAIEEKCNSRLYNKLVESSFYQRVCGFFAFEIKHDSVVNNIFESQLLVNIDTKINDITNILSSKGESFLPELTNIENEIAEGNKNILEIHELLLKSFVDISDKIEGMDKKLDILIERKDSTEEMRLHHQPKRPTQHFVGREAQLKEIDKKLNQYNYVVLTGMGGIGKTELAKQYAWDACGKKQTYDIVQFVNYRHSLRETIALQLSFHNFDAVEAQASKMKPKDAIAYKFKEKIAQMNKSDVGRILIIIDNYKTPLKKGDRVPTEKDDLNQFISGSYKVIFTSREEDMGSLIKIESMNAEEDLFSLFCSYFNDEYHQLELTEENKPVIRSIIELVNSHTMTIMLIATAMRESEIPPKTMLKRLQEGFEKLRTEIELDKEGLDSASREQTIEMHIQTLFDMSEIEANTNYAYIMTNMAIVPESGLELKIFYKWALSEWYKNDDSDDKNYTDMNHLIKRNWIKVTYKEKTPYISLHRLISDVANKKLKPDSNKCSKLIEHLVDVAFNDFGIEKDTQYRVLAEKIVNMLELACKRIHDETILSAKLWYLFSTSSHWLADFDNALQYFKKTAKVYEKKYGVENDETLDAYSQIAEAYFAKGQYDQSLYWAYKLNIIQEQKLGNKHPDTAEAYNLISRIYLAQANFSESLKWAYSALDIFNNLPDQENTEILSTYFLIMSANNAMGNPSQVSEWSKKILSANKTSDKDFFDFSTMLCDTVNSIGSLAQGNLRQALEKRKSTLEAIENVFGPRHPNTANLYTIIADLHHRLGDYSQALEMAQKALDIHGNVPGVKEHPDIAVIYTLISSVYASQKDYDHMLEWAQEALGIFEKESNLKHPKRCDAYYNIATFYLVHKDYIQAEEWFQKAVLTYEESLGNESLNTAGISMSIANAYNAQDLYNQALDWYQKAVGWYQKAADQGNAYAQNNLGNCYYSGKGVEQNYEKAVGWYQKAAEQGYANAQINLGYRYYDGKGIEQSYEKAVDWYQKAADQGNAEAQNSLANCYYDGKGVAQDYEKAVEWYQKAADQGYAHAQINLGYRYYDGKGVEQNYEKAVDWYQKAADQGYASAQNNLGNCYYSGKGVEQNYEKAVGWCQKAAEQGYANAQINLGYRYYDGKGVEQSYEKAVGWYQKAADQGNAEAQNSLANCYYNGKGVAHDYEKAVGWYQKAAEQGYANAQNNLGNCYNSGKGVEQNYEKAVEWFQKAADQGYANAQINLGNCYYRGNGVEQSYEKAVGWYQKAAEQRYAEAQNNLGICYYRGEGVEQDYENAAKWYQKAAEQEYANAQNDLGTCYYRGEGVEQSYEKAVKWYQKAAEQGYANAQINLGYRYYSGEGIEQDYEKAVEWYLKAADQGNAEAQNNLGNCYYSGKGVEQNYEKAVDWYQKAADQGNAEAQNNLGNCYYRGEGIEQNYEKAVGWYQKVAEQGNADAQINLGSCYYSGKGIEQNYEKAVEWFKKAADQGYANAQINLGYCYYRGEGVEQSYEKAVEWFQKAADQGYANAQINLGYCYYRGEGVEQSYEKAIEWWKKAAEQGNEDAQRCLDQMLSGTS